MIRIAKSLFTLPLSTVLLCGVFIAGPATTAAQDAPKTESAATGQEATKARLKRSLATKIWWNQPDKISAIALNDAQRARMDEILKTYLESRAPGLQAQRQAMEELGEAIAKGDEAAIRERAEAVAEAAARPVREQVAMMTEVAAVLSAEQRQKLVESYPRMFSRPWIRNVDPRRLRRGSGG